MNIRMFTSGYGNVEFGVRCKNVTYSQRENVVLCIDTSRSMCRRDYSPNRMEAAKKAALEFITKKNRADPGDRISIVTFSDIAVTEQALTNNAEALEKTLERIGVDGASRMDLGLNLALGILAALHGERILRIVVLSDGRPYGATQDPLQIALKARRLGVIIDTIGIGKPGSNDFGDSLLKAIARTTDGEYAYVTSASRLIREFVKLAPKKLAPLRFEPQSTTSTTGLRGLILSNITSQAVCAYCHQKITVSAAYRCMVCGALFDETCVRRIQETGSCPFCKSPF